MSDDLSKALKLHKKGKLNEAEEIYLNLLKTNIDKLGYLKLFFFNILESDDFIFKDLSLL